MRYLAFALALLTVFAFASQASAADNILFILDGSGSMWGKAGGETKIQTAKELLTALIADLPGDAGVGLMSYGHRREGDCEDVEILAPPARNDPARLKKIIESINPKGKTPLRGSLHKVLPVMAEHIGERNAVVLVSDGEDTCGGDPCAGAAALASAGLNLKIHVVGFDVNREQRAQLECIADKGGGLYFQADDSAGLEKALAQVKVAVTEPEPEPEPEPAEPKVVFVDDFEGEELAEHWEIINPDMNGFIQDGGSLILVLQPGDFREAGVPNLFLLDRELPEGDWRATLRLRSKVQTDRTKIFLGLYQDPENMVLSVAGSYGDRHLIQAEKLQSGKPSWVNETWNHRSILQGEDVWLRMTKQGRTYLTEYSWDGEEYSPAGEMTMLRIKGRLAIGGYHGSEGAGETTAEFDRLVIESMPGS